MILSRNDDLTSSPTYSKVVKNEGMPNPKTGERGDLIITFKTSFPTSLTLEQKTLLRKAFH
jgi:DnaJ homolog subfamily B member 4